MVNLPTETPKLDPVNPEVAKGVDNLLVPTRQLNGLANQEQWSKDNNPNRQAATSLLGSSTAIAEMLLTIETKSHADPKLSGLITNLIDNPEFKSLAGMVESVDTDRSLSFQLVSLLKTINKIAKP